MSIGGNRATLHEMAHVAADAHRECLHLPRGVVRFPVEWRPHDGFRVDEPASWPDLDGRLEFVGGRIQYLRPCGEQQQDVATDVTGTLYAWLRAHPDFVVGTNEAGMLLDGEVRGADLAVWRRADAGVSKGFRRKPPVLAVEIAGEDEDEAVLRTKASWYLDHGCLVVWLVFPDARQIVVITPEGESRHQRGERLPAHSALPDLEPPVDDLFWQIDGAMK